MHIEIKAHECTDTLSFALDQIENIADWLDATETVPEFLKRAAAAVVGDPEWTDGMAGKCDKILKRIGMDQYAFFCGNEHLIVEVDTKIATVGRQPYAWYDMPQAIVLDNK